MSADELRNREDGPREENRPVVSGAILAWMQREGHPDLFTSEQDPEPHSEPEPHRAERSDFIAETAPATDEILSTLLKAIESTDLAAELERAGASGAGPFVAPDPANVANAGFEPPIKEDQPAELLESAKRLVKPSRARAAPKSRAQTKARVDAVPKEPLASEVTEASPDCGPQTIAETAHPSPVPIESAQAVRSRRPSRTGNTARRSPAPGRPQTKRRPGTLSIAEVAPPSATPQPDTSIEAASEPVTFDTPLIPAPTAIVSETPALPESIQPLPVFLAPMLPIANKGASAENASVTAQVSAAVAEVATAAPAGTQPPVEAESAKILESQQESVAPSRLAQKVGLTAERLTSAGKQLSALLKNLFVSSESRRGRRLSDPPLLAYPWAAGSREGQMVVNISSTGLHLLTEERWPPGGTLCMTLQRTDKARGSPGSWIVVEFRVVRWCENGLAGAFIPSLPGRSYSVIGRAENCADEKTLHRFVKQLEPAQTATGER